MKTKLTRLERIAAVVEDSIEKLLANSDKGDDNIYIYRYNFWSSLLDEEIKKNINVDTSKLKVSKFMEQIISHYIVRKQKIDDIYSMYTGWRSDDRHHMKYREQKIKDLYRL